MQDFQKYLEKQGSRYQFYYEPKTRPGTKAGRPSIVSFEFVYEIKAELLNRAKIQGPNLECIDLLRNLVPILQKKDPNIMSFSEIHHLLVEKDLEQTFCQAMAVYTKLKADHQANTMKLILIDRYNIDITRHVANRKI